MSTSAPLQEWQAERYAQNARFVSDLGTPVVELLAPRPGERVLDLGCGDGALTLQLERRGAVVVGVDASADMIRRAREQGLDAQVVDGAALAFDHEFDAVFSNAALHWMKSDPDAVIQGVARSLRPGGRFVGEMGGHGNVAAITVALTAVLERFGQDGAAANPWYFPTPRGLSGAPRGGGFRRAADRAYSEAHAARGRDRGLARDLRRAVPAAAARARPRAGPGSDDQAPGAGAA